MTTPVQSVVVEDSWNFPLSQPYDQAFGLVKIENLSALIASTFPTTPPPLVIVAYNWVPGDGGGEFEWAPLSTTPSNFGTVIKLTTVTTGRYIRRQRGNLKSSWFGVGRNPTGDEGPDLANALSALREGVRLDLEGRSVKTSQNHTMSVSNSGVCNGTIVLIGSTSQVGLTASGTETAITYSGAPIAAGATSSVFSGANASWVGKDLYFRSQDRSTNVIAGYKRGEVVRVASVVGTTVNFEGPLFFSYQTSITVHLLDRLNNLRFELSFVGDPAKTQRGLVLQYCEKSKVKADQLNVGDSCVAIICSSGIQVNHTGGNPLILTDNGTDYGVVFGNGCVACTFTSYSHNLRHAISGGNTPAADMNITIIAYLDYGKDAAVDCHANVIHADIKGEAGRRRLSGAGGTFSNQPSCVAFQGGGKVQILAIARDFHETMVLLQPFQDTVSDEFDIVVRGSTSNLNSSLAYRGVFFDNYKTIGSIDRIDIDCGLSGLPDSHVNSQIVQVDTLNSGAGQVIKYVKIKISGHSPGAYAALVLSRSGKPIHHVQFVDSHITGVKNGNRGLAVGCAVSSDVKWVQASRIFIDGVGGTIGIDTSAAIGGADVLRSDGLLVRVTGCGGADIKANALRLGNSLTATQLVAMSNSYT